MVPPVSGIINGDMLDYVEVKRITASAQGTAVAPDDDELPF